MECGREREREGEREREKEGERERERDILKEVICESWQEIGQVMQSKICPFVLSYMLHTVQ